MKIMTRMRVSYTPRVNRRSVSVVDQSTRACHLEMSLVLSIIHSLILNGIISYFLFLEIELVVQDAFYKHADHVNCNAYILVSSNIVKKKTASNSSPFSIEFKYR